VPTPIPQAAAVPLSAGSVCLVTSRSGKGWIVPKGRLERGKTVAEIALQEAWEEAGLLGFLHDRPVGAYRYEKVGNLYEVTVFLMEVTQVEDDWPEADERLRSWQPLKHAHRRVYQPGLAALLRKLGTKLHELPVGR